MPRYYFHLYQGSHLIAQDEAGYECVDDEEARQFARLSKGLVALDPFLSGWPEYRFEVVNDRRKKAALRLDCSTRVPDDCDVVIALRIVAIRRAHESMRKMKQEGDVPVVGSNAERGDERGLDRVHDGNLLRVGVALPDMDADTGHEALLRFGNDQTAELIALRRYPLAWNRR